MMFYYHLFVFIDVPCGVASKKSLCNEMPQYIALLGFFM